MEPRHERTHATSPSARGGTRAGLGRRPWRVVRLASAVVVAVAVCGAAVQAASSPPAAAATVADGCTIVANPTPTDHTSCPGTHLEGAGLNGLDLAYADLAGAYLAACTTTFSGSSCSTATFADSDLEDADLAHATLSGCGGSCGAVAFTGANLAGADVTGTSLVPADASATSTATSGTVVTWSTPPAVSGATPGTCTPGSGSHFSLGVTVVTCAVTDDHGGQAHGTFTVTVDVLPSVELLTPAQGAVLSSGAWLDAGASSVVGVQSIEFLVNAVGSSPVDLAEGVPTLDGWVSAFDTAATRGVVNGVNQPMFANGTYQLRAQVTDVLGAVVWSAPVTVTIDNRPLSTTVLVPGPGAVLRTGSVLDAAATSVIDVSSVRFELSGGPSTGAVTIGTAGLTVFGWIATADLSGVPPGSYELTSFAQDDLGSTATSPPIPVTVGGPGST